MANFNDGKNNLIEKWNKDFTLKALALGTISFIFTLFFNFSFFGYLFFVLVFTVFDIYGFNNLMKISSLGKKEDIDSTMNYRIIQTIFQWTSLAFIYNSCDIIPVICCLITHFFTGCDWLFYIFTKDPYYYESETNTYPWLEGWSIFLILKHFGITSSKKNFKILANISFIISILILALF